MENKKTKIKVKRTEHGKIKSIRTEYGKMEIAIMEAWETKSCTRRGQAKEEGRCGKIGK